MKKAISAILLLLMCLCMASPSALAESENAPDELQTFEGLDLDHSPMPVADEASASVSASVPGDCYENLKIVVETVNVAANKGDVNVPVHIENGADVTAVLMIADYDDTVLELTEISNGNFFEMSAGSVEKGSFGAMRLETEGCEDATMCTMHFKVKKGAVSEPTVIPVGVVIEELVGKKTGVNEDIYPLPPIVTGSVKIMYDTVADDSMAINATSSTNTGDDRMPELYILAMLGCAAVLVVALMAKRKKKTRAS